VGGLIGHQIRASGAGGSGATRQAACPAETVADDTLPSVVTVNVTGSGGGGNGTGEILRGSGYILTNDHVVAPAGNGGSVAVQLSSGQSLPATITGRAPLVDLAVLKVSADRDLPAIRRGSSNGLRVGQPVVALGAPLGLSGTVTAGIVSALGRDITVPAEGDQSALLVEAIQTDAAINPGNSGGPLVDCSGALVGVNTAIATVPGASGSSVGSVGIGFAIPMDLAQRVADQLISTGRFSPATLGLSVAPIPATVAQQFGVTDGLFVRSVEAGGPAAQAGLAVGDVVTTVEGEAATSVEVLFKAALTRQPGDKITIGYRRAGASRTATLTLGSPR
jgi:putative serine protease PepD